MWGMKFISAYCNIDHDGTDRPQDSLMAGNVAPVCSDSKPATYSLAARMLTKSEIESLQQNKREVTAQMRTLMKARKEPE